VLETGRDLSRSNRDRHSRLPSVHSHRNIQLVALRGAAAAGRAKGSRKTSSKPTFPTTTKSCHTHGTSKCETSIQQGGLLLLSPSSSSSSSVSSPMSRASPSSSAVGQSLASIRCNTRTEEEKNKKKANKRPRTLLPPPRRQQRHAPPLPSFMDSEIEMAEQAFLDMLEDDSKPPPPSRFHYPSIPALVPVRPNHKSL
jgi:hypothetical protein